MTVRAMTTDFLLCSEEGGWINRAVPDEDSPQTQELTSAWNRKLFAPSKECNLIELKKLWGEMKIQKIKPNPETLEFLLLPFTSMGDMDPISRSKYRIKRKIVNGSCYLGIDSFLHQKNTKPRLDR